MSSLSDPPSWARYPFDDPAANIILRSSDRIDFCVYSVILSVASPFFKDMFSLQQPIVDDRPENDTDEYRDGRPVIPVSEGSQTLDSLLRLCYPVRDPDFTKLSLISAVLEAALKYQMDEATALTTRALRTFAPKESLRTWAIACRLRLEEEAKNSATFLLRQPSISGYFLPPEMHEITAGPYFRLLKYHRLKGAVGHNFSFISPHLSKSTVPKHQKSVTATSLGFVTYPFADLICRSSDGVEFQTHRVILSMASPVLHALITGLMPVPQEKSSPNGADGLPTLSLDEDSCTLTALLKLCYSMDASFTAEHDLGVIQPILDAAKKYGMERVMSMVRRQCLSLAKTQPLRTYFTAVHNQFDECARQAAESILKCPIEDTYVSEMENAPARDYYRLLRYYRACQNVVDTALVQYQKRHSDDKLDEPVMADYSFSCTCGAACSNVNMPFKCSCRWKTPFTGQLAEAGRSLRECPSGARNCDSKVISFLKESISSRTSSWCPSCRPLARRLADFAQDVGPAVDKGISQVRLELGP